MGLTVGGPSILVPEGDIVGTEGAQSIIGVKTLHGPRLVVSGAGDVPETHGFAYFHDGDAAHGLAVSKFRTTEIGFNGTLVAAQLDLAVDERVSVDAQLSFSRGTSFGSCKLRGLYWRNGSAAPAQKVAPTIEAWQGDSGGTVTFFINGNQVEIRVATGTAVWTKWTCELHEQRIPGA